MKYTHKFKRKDRAGQVARHKDQRFRGITRTFGSEQTIVVRYPDGQTREEICRQGSLVSLRTPVEFDEEEA